MSLSKSKKSKAVSPSKGLKIERVFTKEGVSPFDMFEYDYRTSVIKNTDGSTVFELKNVEVPKGWSQVATDIIAQKYFRKTGVPQKDGSLGSETSVKQEVYRLAATWRHWGEDNGYFASKNDADIYEQEMQYMMLNQMGSVNSPQHFNTGLAHVYGIKGEPQGHWFVDGKTGVLQKSKDAYSRPAPHACFIQSVDDDLVNEGGIFDLLTREARVFKFGSGTGSNFSKLRGRGEKLSGGGTSSGLMSWLRIYDRAAGAIKSGGTTRRAAKMVVLDIDHPDIEKFVNWKMVEEQKVAALVAGSKLNQFWIERIMKEAKAKQVFDIGASGLKELVNSATGHGVPLNYIIKGLALVQEGKDSMNLPIFDTHYESEAYETVSGQNSNNSIRITNAFLKAVDEDADWNLINRTDGKVAKTIKARDLWNQVALAAWASADPGVQFHDTINEWHTIPKDGVIEASNPCNEYMSVSNSACNLASINLVKFLRPDGSFDVERYRSAIRLWTITLEISVLMAQFPSKEIARVSFNTRNLGLGYANLGTLLMRWGIPYDSPEARAICGATTAILTGQAYATSAELAKQLGAFPHYEQNKEDMLQVIRNHTKAAYNGLKESYQGLSVTPVGIDPKYCPEELLVHAKDCWDEALKMGEKYGYRNSQVTVQAPTGTIGLLLDCDTTGVEPEFAIVKFKKLAGGGYFKIVNQSIIAALTKLGYSPKQIIEIEAYAKGRGTLAGCPSINVQSLMAKGFGVKELEVIESQLAKAFDIKFVFNHYSLGLDFCKNVLKLTDEQLNSPKFNLLRAIGFSKEEIQAANEYICGTMTIEGAPHLKQEHYAVFDCANKCGKKGKRFIQYMAHVEMLAACQSFISGAISKTINMPSNAKVSDVKEVYEKSFKLGVKGLSLYRDGSKLSQPLNASSDDEDERSEEKKDGGAILKEIIEIAEKELPPIEEPVVVVSEPKRFESKRERLPFRRKGFTQEVKIGGHKFYIRTGEYENGEVGEFFVDAYKSGVAYKALLNSFAILGSKALQYGVPLSELVDTFTFTKFEPNGLVQGDANIKNATSILDYTFRLLGSHYLNRNDLVHIKPKGEKILDATSVD